MHELYIAKVKMLDSNNVIKVDQIHIETVIPACGRPVKIVNGAYRGEEAILESLDADNFCVTLKIATVCILQTAYNRHNNIHLQYNILTAESVINFTGTYQGSNFGKGCL